MLLRFLILAAIAFVGLSLASSAAKAEAPKTESSKAAIEREQKSVAPQPTTSHRARLSTRDRWRGRPYLGSCDETLRSHSLDKVLPPANSAFNGGTNLQILSR